MQSPSYEKNKIQSEIISELMRVVRDQLDGKMDWVRARAYWKTRLPELDTALLAEALTTVLNARAVPKVR